MDEYLTTGEVARWLRVAPSTVCRWRLAGKGPRVTWLSPSLPRYKKADLIAWLNGATS
ncbi:helix-turn-helix domain-containing protein [Cellulomonas sp.]|uniref:helix-turn-helix transcriptional regulator n=1 Tax=Cellulomonas sp. TaxID=40001 RepID=UPI001B161225|nr:helix-turn-helix domain-containing protein [Cellulomonas sp.]MBO9553210.1 helix-turn-helix domain-containing protein [Cellulomonas sp.]